MPKPNPNEPHDDFIKRCIPFVIKEGTAKDGSQGKAICESIWERKDKGKKNGKALGGPGSGHFGHKGRPGQRGGSLPGSVKPKSDTDKFSGKLPHKNAGRTIEDVKAYVTARLESYGFPKDKITFNESPYFGSYRTRTNTINVDADALLGQTENQIKYVTDHEFQHHVFNKILREPTSEWMQSRGITRTVNHQVVDSVSKDLGFPSSLDMLNELESTDGVTLYSVSHWHSISGKKEFSWRAINETLAEIAAIVKGAEPFGGVLEENLTPAWLGLYEAIRNRYNEKFGTKILGGPGSGHFGHKGRPGKRGGSLPGTSSKRPELTLQAYSLDELKKRFKPHPDYAELGLRDPFSMSDDELERKISVIRSAIEGRGIDPNRVTFEDLDDTYIFGSKAAAIYRSRDLKIVFDPDTLRENDDLLAFLAAHEAQHFALDWVTRTTEKGNITSYSEAADAIDGYIHKYSDLLEREDGVTDYSSQYWDDFSDMEDRSFFSDGVERLYPNAVRARYKAVNETLAEIAAISDARGRGGGSFVDEDILEQDFHEVWSNLFDMVWREFEARRRGRILGGPGSGHFGHKGRPGKRGGSAPGDGPAQKSRAPKKPKSKKFTGSDDEIPPEPGTTPVPKGKIRGYHYTGDIDSVLREGLLRSKSRGETYGEPNVIWFSAEKPEKHKDYVEVFIDPEDIALGFDSWRGDQEYIDDFNAGASNFAVGIDRIPPENFVTYFKKWHYYYRYMTENERVRKRAVAGEYEYLLDDPDYKPAIIKIKKDFGPKKNLRRSVQSLGGPGSGHFGHKGRPGKRGGSAPSGKEKGDSLSARVLRHTVPVLSQKKIRTAQYNNVDHIIVPVVALLGDAFVKPVNAGGRKEFVPASELSKAPAGWNGRPVLFDHPMGGFASANDPKILEQMSFGQLFNTRYEDGKLKTEAWLDPVKARKIGPAAMNVLDRIQSGEGVEVSIGAFVSTQEGGGEFNGEPYDSLWYDIKPDHLAMLPPGIEGACSIEMGCGAPRLNKRWKELGGKGSGHHGHKGRPGKRGGSLPNPNQMRLPISEEYFQYNPRILLDASNEEIDEMRKLLEGEAAIPEHFTDEYAQEYGLYYSHDMGKHLIDVQIVSEEEIRELLELTEYDDIDAYMEDNPTDYAWVEDEDGEYHLVHAEYGVPIGDVWRSDVDLDNSGYGEALFDDAYRSGVKSEISSDIYDTIKENNPDLADDISRYQVEQIIRKWADTSGDADPVAIAQQLAIQEEFGLVGAQLNHWSVDYWADARAHMRTAVSSGSKYTLGDLYKAFARAEYENTQKYLEDAGIDFVTVVRGVRGQRTKYTNTSSEIGSIRLQPASSFSAHWASADAFYNSTRGRMFVTRVPRDMVLSTARTGRGCLSEFEVLLLGGYAPAYTSSPGSHYQSTRMDFETTIQQYFRSRRNTKFKGVTPKEFGSIWEIDVEDNDADWPKHRYNDDTEYLKKQAKKSKKSKPKKLGGPGSGHFGHKGRPGQRGGSLPNSFKTAPPKIQGQNFGETNWNEELFPSEADKWRQQVEAAHARLEKNLEMVKDQLEAKGFPRDYVIVDDLEGNTLGKYEATTSGNPLIVLDSSFLMHGETDRIKWTAEHEFMHHVFHYALKRHIEAGEITELSQHLSSIARELSISDGVTEYSMDHWQRYYDLAKMRSVQGLTSVRNSAINETLAELAAMARVDRAQFVEWKNAGSHDEWFDLFLRVVKEYRKEFPADFQPKGLGGPGSGHWGHRGRPGKRGGSLPGGGSHMRPENWRERRKSRVKRKKKYSKPVFEPRSKETKYGKPIHEYDYPPNYPYDPRYWSERLKERAERAGKLAETLGFEGKFRIDPSFSRDLFGQHSGGDVALGEYFVKYEKNWDRVEWTLIHEVQHAIYWEVIGEKGFWGEPLIENDTLALLSDNEFLAKLIKKRGVSEYSNQYWAYVPAIWSDPLEIKHINLKHNYISYKWLTRAINETLADTAAYVMRHGEEAARKKHPEWTELYAATLRDYFERPYDPRAGVPGISQVSLGGKGSGNFGHKGRPGKVGGSAPDNIPNKEPESRPDTVTPGGEGVKDVMDTATPTGKGVKDVMNPVLLGMNEKTRQLLKEQKAGRELGKTEIWDSLSPEDQQKVHAYIGRAASNESLYKQWIDAGAEQFNMEKGSFEEAAPGTYFYGPLKKAERVAAKAVSDYHGDLSKVGDVLRMTYVVENPSDALDLFTHMSQSDSPLGLKNRFVNPLPVGYRDVMFKMQLPDGMRAEVQINTQSMLKAKEGHGHEIYKRMRSMTRDNPEYSKLQSEAQSLYGAAWSDVCKQFPDFAGCS